MSKDIMTNDDQKNKKQAEKNTFISFLMWWKIGNDEIKKQVEGYDTLKFFDSARGGSIGCIIFSIVVMAIFALWQKNTESLISIFILVFLGLFIYRGHRWASILMMIDCTASAIFKIIEYYPKGYLSFTPILFWVIFMRYFYLTFRVERERNKIKKAGDAGQRTTKEGIMLNGLEVAKKKLLLSYQICWGALGVLVLSYVLLAMVAEMSLSAISMILYFAIFASFATAFGAFFFVLFRIRYVLAAMGKEEDAWLWQICYAFTPAFLGLIFVPLSLLKRVDKVINK